ncbi:MAG: response regulator [Chloroflexi bacterium]|nr:response regulator [Chloroflexota bacterium]
MAKILIVDDDVEVTSLFEKFLSLEGYETTSLNESAQALDIANSIVPDLFILDLMMPPPDGFKLCRLLREQPKFAHTPIIIITALSDNDSKAVAYGAGANDYLTKPFHINELAQIVKSFL